MIDWCFGSFDVMFHQLQHLLVQQLMILLSAFKTCAVRDPVGLQYIIKAFSIDKISALANFPLAWIEAKMETPKNSSKKSNKILRNNLPVISLKISDFWMATFSLFLPSHASSMPNLSVNMVDQMRRTKSTKSDPPTLLSSRTYEQ